MEYLRRLWRRWTVPPPPDVPPGERRYVRVLWRHSHPDTPVEILSEADEEGWERRKIEVFRDGSASYASEEFRTGDTELDSEPPPTLREWNAHRQFRATLIAAEEFERRWAEVRGK